MPMPKVALQLYCVRNELERDFEGTLKTVAEMGYDGVEFAGDYAGRSAEEVCSILKEFGLGLAGAHVALGLLTGDKFQSTVDYHVALQNTRVVIPWLDKEYRGGRETTLKTVALFNRISAKLRPFGLQTGYHNHNFEFTPLDGGETVWDIVAKNTSPDFILQIDTGNALMGNGDPAEYLRRYPDRAATVHLKEYPDGLLGDGDVAWSEVFNVLREQDCTEWVIVEQEGEKYPPFEYVDRCLQALRARTDFAW